MLPDRQRCRGYSMQSWFIGIGAVVASALPWILTNVFDVANVAEPGQLPQSVKLAFYLGAVAFLGAVLWTVLQHARVLAGGTRRVRRACRRRRGRRRAARAHAGVVSQIRCGLDRRGRGVRGSRCAVRVGQAALRARLRTRRVRPAAARRRGAAAARRHRRHAAQRDQRPVPDAEGDAAAGGRAVPVLVRAVRDVDLHDRGGHRAPLRHDRCGLCGLQRGSELGRHPFRRVQRFCRARRAVHPEARRNAGPSQGAPGLPLVRCARPAFRSASSRTRGCCWCR